MRGRLAFLVWAFASGCTGRAPCSCPIADDPVCARDGITYASACNSACAGATIVRPGACAMDGPLGCNCPAVSDPVCGANGRTYDNACRATCAGVGIAHAGACAGAGCDAGIIDCAVPRDGCTANVVCRNGMLQCDVSCPDA